MRSFAMLVALVGFTVSSAADLKISSTNSKIGFVGAKTGGSHTGGFKQFTGTVSLPSDDFSAATVT